MENNSVPSIPSYLLYGIVMIQEASYVSSFSLILGIITLALSYSYSLNSVRTFHPLAVRHFRYQQCPFGQVQPGSLGWSLSKGLTLKCNFSGRTSGRSGTSLSLSPLRTECASFQAFGSSNVILFGNVSYDGKISVPIQDFLDCLFLLYIEVRCGEGEVVHH